MVQIDEQSLNLEGYQLHLAVFEGPLDVLLRLIERRQLTITDVSLVQVTDQFLEYVAALGDVQADVLGDFTATASRLLLLKSRRLLPVDKSSDEPEPDDLTRQLIEYKAVKEASEKLRERIRLGQRSFPRLSGPPYDLEPVQYMKPGAPAQLVQALRRMFARQVPEPESFRPRPVISLHEMTRRIIQCVTRGMQRFSQVVEPSAGRSDIAVGFIALLALRKQQQINAEQHELFGEIYISPNIVDQKQRADD